ncbi:serine/threonine-protein kinase [Streptomyces cavernae]|uniref:serine/threonine-protein kinase n=1 Tax=Streptomyces cavernae TaxID=2259034 RepID=UPI000FEC1FCE|nr:serine/threonine-protein kinase [Streptomyces cavernae]
MNDAESGRRIVDGRFELEARLGGGGMGTVWRARDLVLQRSVAIKEVRPPDIDLAEYDPDGARTLRERVLREARALARVDHPNVVTIYHIVDNGAGTNPWIVMELVEGGSLADRLGRGRMAPVEAARLGREVLAALRAAHAAGVEHRDVKPANVLLRRDGRPVLTDFGIAAVRGSSTLTATGAIIGTPDYMAPERVAGNPGGPEADLWSLAMMLYAAVEGHHPLRRGTTLATLAAVLYDDVPPPAQAGPLTAVLTQVLVRDPVARPDAETVDRMLAAAEADTPPAAPTSYPLAPPPPMPAPNTFATGPSTSGHMTGHQTWGPRDAVPSEFGPPSTVPSDAVPPGFGPPGVPAYPGAPGPAPHKGDPSPRRPGRSARSLAVVSSAAAVVLAGGLLWQLLPGDGANGAKTSPDTVATPSRTTSTTPAATATVAGAETPEEEEAAAEDLLTPDGIRTALKAIEKESGRNMYGDLTVYPEHVSASVMVEGSRTKYDTYTYFVGRGVEQGIISGSLIGDDKPVSLKGFNWDAVPSLLKQAEKKLNVDDPTTRYLLLRQEGQFLGTKLGFAVYLSNEYGQTGYLEADRQGKVTKTMPNGE